MLERLCPAFTCVNIECSPLDQRGPDLFPVRLGGGNHTRCPASATTRRTPEFHGSMSLVGPRPMIDEVIEELEPDDRIIRRKDRGSVRQSVELQLLQILGGIGGTHQHTRDRIAR